MKSMTTSYLDGTSLTMSDQEISAEKAREAAPKSISSSTVGNVSHMDWAGMMRDDFG